MRTGLDLKNTALAGIVALASAGCADTEDKSVETQDDHATSVVVDTAESDHDLNISFSPDNTKYVTRPITAHLEYKDGISLPLQSGGDLEITKLSLDSYVRVIAITLENLKFMTENDIKFSKTDKAGEITIELSFTDGTDYSFDIDLNNTKLASEKLAQEVMFVLYGEKMGFDNSGNCRKIGALKGLFVEVTELLERNDLESLEKKSEYIKKLAEYQRVRFERDRDTEITNFGSQPLGIAGELRMAIILEAASLEMDVIIGLAQLIGTAPDISHEVLSPLKILQDPNLVTRGDDK